MRETPPSIVVVSVILFWPLCVRLVKYLFFYLKCKCSGIFFYHFALIIVRYLSYSCDRTSNIVYSEILPLGILRS